MDALCGYWRIPLAEEDQALTTFITPYGRYRYLRSPMGFSGSGDAYCRRVDIALQAEEEKVQAISEFPKPANLTDLRSFMGLTNQLTEFSSDLAAPADPLQPVMSPKRSFTWTEDRDAVFASVKKALSATCASSF
ncbi:uncharacterized protein [Palaemon carinicauda]|uniref:uncharacterized protein n=1 Tax=Palaemon carinicauda TaxID=392227 RepID=UPI0035B64217